MVEWLAELADVRSNTVGLALEEERLPQRICRSRTHQLQQPQPEGDSGWKYLYWCTLTLWVNAGLLEAVGARAQGRGKRHL
jgi:hypothetical protein